VISYLRRQSLHDSEISLSYYEKYTIQEGIVDLTRLRPQVLKSSGFMFCRMDISYRPELDERISLTILQRRATRPASCTRVPTPSNMRM
jgi:hypothetical protein